jgi:hypothetical protein
MPACGGLGDAVWNAQATCSLNSTLAASNQIQEFAEGEPKAW